MMISNYENYGPFVPLVKHGTQNILISDITRHNYDEYFNGILNIMRDGIELPEVQSLKIVTTLDDGNKLPLVTTDFWFNLIFWLFRIYLDKPVTVKYIFDTRAITKNSIKEYFNMLIKESIETVDFIKLNNLLDEVMSKFKYIEEFAMYLCNSLNFKDTLDLMEKYPEFNESMHVDFSTIPIENVKSVGMEYTKTQIKYIKDHNHCLRDSFTACEAISPKQFKEVSVNIGTKPDGQGGIFPYIVNNSFMNGGVSTLESFIIDSSSGRTAQILSKLNIGISGAFARILEINNIDTYFNTDVNYVCDTKNFIKVFIENANWLKTYDKRYYKFNPKGPDYLLDKDRDFHLIGKTLYFRSPMTCASKSRGEGICHRCYGDLYYINRDINPGKLAAELLSAVYTQMLLSAKHLLESSIIEIKWNSEFYDIFEINLNTISIDESVDTTDMYMVIDSNQMDSMEEDDNDFLYEESIPSFDIIYPDGHRVTFSTMNDDDIFLTEDLNCLLRSKKVKDNGGVYTIPLSALKDIQVVFTMKLQNKELQATLEKSKHLLNRKRDTSRFDKDSIVRELILTNMEGGVNITAIHLEVLLSNQIRDDQNIFDLPDWSKENVKYSLLTLQSALTNSPSITANLEYQKVGQILVSPLSTKKRKPSVYDLFFMEKPQDYIVDKSMVSDEFKTYS